MPRCHAGFCTVTTSSLVLTRRGRARLRDHPVVSGRPVIPNTSRFADVEVSELVRFALSEIDARGVCVNVKNSSATRRGRAYSRIPAISNAPADSRYLITIGIGAPDRFPFEDGSYTRRNGEVVKRRGGRWPVETLADWREAL